MLGKFDSKKIKKELVEVRFSPNKNKDRLFRICWLLISIALAMLVTGKCSSLFN